MNKTGRVLRNIKIKQLPNWTPFLNTKFLRKGYYLTFCWFWDFLQNSTGSTLTLLYHSFGMLWLEGSFIFIPFMVYVWFCLEISSYFAFLSTHNQQHNGNVLENVWGNRNGYILVALVKASSSLAIHNCNAWISNPDIGICRAWVKLNNKKLDVF